jgi:hypothetical protein
VGLEPLEFKVKSTMPLNLQVLSNFKFKYFFGGQIYHNLNIGVAIKCVVQRPMRLKECG